MTFFFLDSQVQGVGVMFLILISATLYSSGSYGYCIIVSQPYNATMLGKYGTWYRPAVSVWCPVSWCSLLTHVSEHTHTYTCVNVQTTLTRTRAHTALPHLCYSLCSRTCPNLCSLTSSWTSRLVNSSFRLDYRTESYRLVQVIQVSTGHTG